MRTPPRTGSLLGAAALCLATVSTAWAVPVVAPTSLSPGDRYRLAFVTRDFTTATSSDIADYNAFVADAAAGVPELAALGTSWYAIASTPAVDAINNTKTDGSLPDVPIYLLNDTKLVDGNADLWDGDLDTPLLIGESGFGVSIGEVWTGTFLNGEGISVLELGSIGPQSSVGLGLFPDRRWVAATVLVKDELARLYALSDVLTVPDPLAVDAPEPATPALLAAGLLWAAARRSCRRKGRKGDALISAHVRMPWTGGDREKQVRPL